MDRITQWLKTRCTPSEFRAGVYLLAVELIEDVDTQLQEYAAERQGLVREFVKAYPPAVLVAKKRLRTFVRDASVSTAPPVR